MNTSPVIINNSNKDKKVSNETTSQITCSVVTNVHGDIKVNKQNEILNRGSANTVQNWSWANTGLGRSNKQGFDLNEYISNDDGFSDSVFEI